MKKETTIAVLIL